MAIHAQVPPELQRTAWPRVSSLLDFVDHKGDQAFLCRKPADALVVVFTKDTPQRLGQALAHLHNSEFEVIVLDDSTSEETRRAAHLIALDQGVRYHGRLQQRDMVTNLTYTSATSFNPTLGNPDWQLGKCRNYAVLLAAHSGYQKLIMMDDDILTGGDSHLHRTARLLDSHTLAGSIATGMPDDSVVGHIYRHLNLLQYTFISGQYLGIRIDKISNFFPDAYNEDWLFVLLEAYTHRPACHGTVVQLNFDPFKDAVRKALFQEAGELLCLGLSHAAVHRIDPAILTDRVFWQYISHQRLRSLKKLDALLMGIHTSHRLGDVVKHLQEFHCTSRLEPAAFFEVYFSQLPAWSSALRTLSSCPTLPRLIRDSESDKTSPPSTRPQQ